MNMHHKLMSSIYSAVVYTAAAVFLEWLHNLCKLTGTVLYMLVQAQETVQEQCPYYYRCRSHVNDSSHTHTGGPGLLDQDACKLREFHRIAHTTYNLVIFRI